MEKTLTLQKLFSKSKAEYRRLLRDKFPCIVKVFQNKDQVIIFGAARMGKSFLNNLRKEEVSVVAFIDNNKSIQGTSIDGIPILSLEKAKKKYSEYPVFIASSLYESALFKDLKRYAFKRIYPLSFLNVFYPSIFISPEYDKTFDVLFLKDNQKDILRLFQLLGDDISKKVLLNLIAFRLFRNKRFIQHSASSSNLFTDKTVLPLSYREVFVDAGAFDGDTLETFYRATKGRFAKVYSFEPDHKNLIKLKQRINKLHINSRVKIVAKGIYDHSGYIDFDERGTVDSRITQKNTFHVTSKSVNNAIPLVSLDEFFSKKCGPTFIKMDIEGVEREALMGAKKTIMKYKPKLAISVYHHATDLWRLPLLIKKLNNGYALYLRHYSDEIVDTICFAV